MRLEVSVYVAEMQPLKIIPPHFIMGWFCLIQTTCPKTLEMILYFCMYLCVAQNSTANIYHFADVSKIDRGTYAISYFLRLIIDLSH